MTEETPRVFRPCATCRWAFIFKREGTAGCNMFGAMSRAEARRDHCGRHGDAWEATPHPGYGAATMYERILG